jgi:hypothetical protein
MKQIGISGNKPIVDGNNGKKEEKAYQKPVKLLQIERCSAGA